MRDDCGVGIGVVVGQKFERAIGEHHAKAERGVGRILLEHANVGIRLPAFDEVGQIKPGRPGAENGDAHG
jgi:hypothetical protein